MSAVLFETPLTVAALCFGLVFVVFSLRRKTGNLPPGPPRGWFGDNRTDVPAEPWVKFTEWQKQYGNVISFRLGRTPVIVLGTLKASLDLLEKRGGIYSDRPRNIVGGEILSGGMRGSVMPYGQRWRNWRALMHAGLGVQAAQQYKVLQNLDSQILLRDLITETDPTKHGDHIRRFISSISFYVGYGRRVKSLDEDAVVANQKIDNYFNSVLTPGRFIVDSFPILMWLPRPLQWFRREPERHRAHDTKTYMSLMNDVKRQMEQGTAQPSTATRALEKQANFGLNDVETAYALSSPWSAGVGTTSASFSVFLMAMLLFPAAQKAAQAELDEVVGHDRLPEFTDADNLPYIMAALKESLRWRPIAPTGVPHAVIEDDVYEGMFIPKGSIVFSNTYAICRDTSLFPDPDEFRPERFLENPKLMSFMAPFGFGRRICPGLHIAQQSIFILMARMLWTFDIVPLKDSEGRDILPDPNAFLRGLIRAPKPFGYQLVPRRESVSEIINTEAERADAELAAWK
ncbi:cytochrome P450 [Pluteus cervinus]|uniref:Cytochrome P450 n=1 Tax=Pluteus cervinus TaxID=181527 RepID=A0ACD3B4P1_9AGAR|nr:cytochrome P450 [Pluteus cervinus]